MHLTWKRLVSPPLPLLLVLLACDVTTSIAAELPTIHEVARWPLWPSYNSAIAVNDTQIFAARTLSGFTTFHTMYRVNRTTGALQALFNVQKDTTDFWSMPPIRRFGTKGDTLVVPVNWLTNAGGSRHGIVRLYRQNGTQVAEWPEKHFPRHVRGAVYSGTKVWVLHDGTGPLPNSSACVAPTLIRYDVDGTNGMSIPLAWPPDSNCHEGFDIAPDIDGGVVVVFSTANAVVIRRYSPAGVVLAERVDPEIFRSLWQDQAGRTFARSFTTGALVVFDTQLVEVGRIAGDDTALGRVGDNYFAGDRFCRLYTRASDGQAIDSLRVLTADPHDSRSGDCWKPLLLVHGICGNADDWAPFARVLADSGYLVRRLKYGSTFNGQPFSLRPAAYVRTLAASLDSIGSDSIAVVAHSMGGLIAREYIRRRALNGATNNIGHLITLGTPHHGSDMAVRGISIFSRLDHFLFQNSTTLGWFGIGCLRHRSSRPALLDMIPGAWFLNRLNYGTDTASYDRQGSHGWSTHQPESGIASDMYIASIAGTGSFCSAEIRSYAWGEGGEYHDNDCTVATGGAVLESEAVFAVVDTLLDLPRPLAHIARGTTPCGVPFVESDSLAQRIVEIIRTSPTNLLKQRAAMPPRQHESGLTLSDTLALAPPVVDSVMAGELLGVSLVVDTTSVAYFTGFSTDAHLLLVTPLGDTLSVADTSAVGGIGFYQDDVPGIEGFAIEAPTAGTWRMVFDARTSIEEQKLVAVLEYRSPTRTRLTVNATRINHGDSLRIVAELMDGAGRRDDATWTGTVAGPQGASAVITLFDDGLHGDGGSGDGIFGNSVFPADGYGYYVVSSTASAPGIGPFATSAFCEVAPVDDLAIGQSDIYLSDNVPEMGDSLVAYATVHNTGASAAVDVSVEFFDRRAGRIIGRTAIDVPASGAATAEVPWTPTSPDSQAIEVRVSPYVLDEVSYSNNSATREFVLGSPIGVAADGRAPKLRFAPPRPNPSVGGATFHFSLPSTAATSLEIFDILGRRVRSWQWTRLQAGDHSITWDGRGESGRRLMAGVYVCRVTFAGQQQQWKLVLRM